MEIAGKDGSKIELKPFSNTVFGRGSGFITTDRTISRRHVLFSLKDPSNETKTEPRACFEVIGKNPIWVRSGKSGEVKAFRRSEKGEVVVGDWFSIGGGQSPQPLWFAVKRRNELEEVKKMEVGESSELSFGELESLDVSNIDPLKEFGFLVIGHEFDQYPKEKIWDMKNWDWFLEESRKDSDEDDEVSDTRKKRGLRRKRGKATKKDDVEDDWTGESEEDLEVIAKVKKIPRPTYSTRSKDRGKLQKGMGSLVQKKSTPSCAEESEDEDEDDPTLDGFLVDDEEAELEVESNVDQEEEDEFDDDDDDVDDD